MNNKTKIAAWCLCTLILCGWSKDAPVLLSVGILADARNCRPIEIQMSGGTFAVDKDKMTGVNGSFA